MSTFAEPARATLRPTVRSRTPWLWRAWVLVLCLGFPALGASNPSPFHPDKLAAMDAAVTLAISDRRCPGGVLWFEHNGSQHHKAFGNRAVVPSAERMTEDTIFDAASLTKVLATTPSILLLVERGKVRLDDPVGTYLSAFRGEGRDAITVRHLLTHTSGLRPSLPSRTTWSGYAKGIELACAEKPAAKPGAGFRYSDINFILLGEIVRRVSGQPLDEFAAREIYKRLGMSDTGFLPPKAKRGRIAPTEKEADGVVRGVVHDPTARRMGGVAGHAGVFTTASDLARYARMMLNRGSLDGTRLFKPETVDLMTRVQTPPGLTARRGLGWDIDSPYAGPRGELFPIGSYGHTGWTGTSVWIDPFSRSFLIFLSNRNHPTEDGSVTALRRDLGTLAAEAIADFNFSHVPGALPPAPESRSRDTSKVTPPAREVLNGIDVLVRDAFRPLRDLRVGLITNHTGQDRQRRATIDLLHNAEGVKLQVLFSPEHGIRGQADENVGDSTDEKTGLKVHSLYGERRKPGPEQLQDLDALVFDIQDIGCRFYTYISTLELCLEAASEAGLKFFVLDRVNPITGTAVEGPVHGGESTFVACHAIPLRHGMTAGELARMFVAERNLKTALTVIPVEGWHRAAWFDATGLPWSAPSPNMRTLNAATLYPGIGLLESALSVGRGTDTPFEIVGAPYANDLRLAAELNRAGLPGIRFVPIRFHPRASTFKDQACGGVSLVLTDRDALDAVDLGLTVALVFRRLYPDQFSLEKMLPLLTHGPTLEGVRDGKSLEELHRLWAGDLAGFKARREKYLLYF